MDEPWRAWLWGAAALFVSVVVLAGHEWFDAQTALAASGATTAAFAATAWLSLTHYRIQRDPALLLVAVGAAVLAIQYLLFGQVWEVVSLRHLIRSVSTSPLSLEPSRLAAVPQHAIAWAWLVFAVCLLLVRPWWERRGRPPLRPLVVAGITAGATAVVDLALFIAPPTPRTEQSIRFGVPVTGVSTSTRWIAIVTIVILVTAAGRCIGRPLAGSFVGSLSGAAVAAAFAAAAPLSAQLTDSDLIRRLGTDATFMLAFVAGAFVFMAVVMAMRTDASRMRRATDRADEVLGGRAEIASVIAHDIRSPVSSIKSIAASTVINYDRLDDAQRLEFVGMIDREAKHVLAVVHQMSVALKIDAGSLQLIRRPTAIASVVREAIDEAETDGHPVDVDAAPGITADVDGKWLAEAIRQGLDNAASFSPEGAPIGISIGSGDDGATVIQIADDGPGIPDERREEVFHRFARWRPPGYEDIPGSGLGLFICRGIVREHGGEATLENGAERGTILRILLPWSAD